MEATATSATIAFMGGDVDMTSQDFAEYLGRLTGRPVAVDEWIHLRSGQQARAAGWLAERGLAGEGVRAALNKQFQPCSRAAPGYTRRQL
jgi:hypothetical protein